MSDLPIYNNKRTRLIKSYGKTNPHYGKKPEERTVEELLSSGMINLDKPNGPTSHQVVSWIKDILNVKKVGHGGTLDPKVTGVLPVAIGSATKLLKVLLTAGKEYIGIMRLHGEVDKDFLLSVVKDFVGDIYQIPPVRSAVKRVKRKRRIYYIDIIEVKGKEVLFRVGCEAGTYIRTLCVDIGRKLKVGAHLQELRRTKVGLLDEKYSVTLHDLKDGYTLWKEDGDETEIRKCILPVEELLLHLPKIIVRDSAVDALCHGASLAVPGVLEVDSRIKKGEIVAVMTLKGEAVMVGKSLMTSEEIIEKDTGVCVSPNRVVMKKGTYPAIWKKT